MPINHLKINAIVPELATTSTNQLEMSIFHLFDIIACLHLPGIALPRLQIASTRSPTDVMFTNRHKLAPNRFESPQNVKFSFKRHHRMSPPFQIVPNFVQVTKNRHKFPSNCPESSRNATQRP